MKKKGVEKTDASPPTRGVRRASGPPVLSVVFRTRNRTAAACRCLGALCRNLKYAGSLHFCICDDGSEPGHVAALEDTLSRNGATSFSVHVATRDRWGAGAALNNGLSWSFGFTDIVLTAEDDRLLSGRLDLTPYAIELERSDVAGIVLAARGDKAPDLVECGHPGFGRAARGKRRGDPAGNAFDHPVMLRHRRAFERTGMYLENASPETTGRDARRRFDAAFGDGGTGGLGVLWPMRAGTGARGAGRFRPIGTPASGGRCADESKRRAALAARTVDFHVIVPCFDTSAYLGRCLASVASQATSRSYRVTVVDDRSSGEEALKLARIAARHPFCSFLPLRDKGMAGGARNHAIDHAGVRARYTLFLDSDDEYSDETALETIWSGLAGSGFPDLAFIGYTRNGRAFLPRSRRMVWTAAPWSRCVRTEKLQRFVAGRRMCNDTMQYLRTIDACDSFVNIRKALVRYNGDNRNSGWSNRAVRWSRPGVEGMAMTLLDLLFASYSKEDASREARRYVKFIESRLETALAHLKGTR